MAMTLSFSHGICSFFTYLFKKVKLCIQQIFIIVYRAYIAKVLIQIEKRETD